MKLTKEQILLLIDIVKQVNAPIESELTNQLRDILRQLRVEIDKSEEDH